VAVAVLEAAAAAPAEGAVEEAVLLELRGAMLGMELDRLASVLRQPAPRVEAALELLAARGAVERRGQRWCFA
jgi:hypothetical protein